MTQPNKLVLPVALWGLLQLILLGCGASGFPLWAHHPLPRESLAMQEMLCGQILVISMLFPVLASSRRGLAINMVLIVPFGQLAGFLSNTPQSEIALGVGCVELWMIGLGLWRIFQIDAVVITFAMLLTAGGVAFDYLRWEAHLADAAQRLFTPASLLPAVCLEHWMYAFSQAATPLITLPIVLLGDRSFKRAHPHSTSLHKL